jgi:cupin fold WbuC family metalloprotein
MKIIDDRLLEEVSAKAKDSPRLRMNFNFHQSLDEKCHRFLNAVEPGTVVPIHRHPTKDETFIVLKGRVKVSTFNDEGEVLESVVLCQDDGMYGVDIPKNVWHTLESLEPDSVIFECKEGPFVEHEEEGVLTLKGYRL